MSKRAKIYVVMVCVFIIAIIASAVYVLTTLDEQRAKGSYETNNVTNVASEEELILDEEGMYNTILEDGTKENTSPKLKRGKYLNDLVISNIKLVEINGVTKLTADITNNTNKTKKEQTVAINLLNSRGQKLATMETYIKQLKNGETTKLNASITFDYSNAYDFTIEKK